RISFAFVWAGLYRACHGSESRPSGGPNSRSTNSAVESMGSKRARGTTLVPAPRCLGAWVPAHDLTEVREWFAGIPPEPQVREVEAVVFNPLGVDDPDEATA